MLLLVSVNQFFSLYFTLKLFWKELFAWLRNKSNYANFENIWIP